MKIRPLVIDDYDALVELWNESELPYKAKGRDRREGIERELAGEGSIFLAAEIDGQLAGAVLGTHDGRKGWINRVAVRPAYRRRGIAKALVAAVDEQLDEFGVEILTCLVEGWNSESLAFFQALGFVSHREIHYLSRRKRDDV